MDTFFFEIRAENCFPNVSVTFRNIPSKIGFGCTADKIAQIISDGQLINMTRTPIFKENFKGSVNFFVRLPSLYGKYCNV